MLPSVWALSAVARLQFDSRPDVRTASEVPLVEGTEKVEDLRRVWGIECPGKRVECRSSQGRSLERLRGEDGGRQGMLLDSLVDPSRIQSSREWISEDCFGENGRLHCISVQETLSFPL